MIFIFTFGELLRRLRKEQFLKADDLAAFIGVKPRSIFAYEKNEVKPSFDVLVTIANYFCVSLDYLVGHSENPYNEEHIIKIENDLLNSEIYFLPFNYKEYKHEYPIKARFKMISDAKRKQAIYYNQIKQNLADEREYNKKFSAEINEICKKESPQLTPAIRSAMHDVGNKFKLYFNPEGILAYKLHNKDYNSQGTIKYTFGLYFSKGRSRRFVYLEQVKGDLLDKIINVPNEINLLAFKDLLDTNLKITARYSLNQNTAIFIKVQEEYKELEIGLLGTKPSVKISNITPAESATISEWLEISKDEKIKLLREKIEVMASENSTIYD